MPNDANVHYRGGMAYHYVTLGDDVVTVPTFNLSMFIDVAHTGGQKAMTQAYQFVVLETPLTFDLVEVVTLACKHARDPDGALICETMKSFWCDIASSMHRMSGDTDGLDASNMARVRYEDLFDDISPFCMWKLFRVSRCIAAARRHMHLMATNVRHSHKGEAWKDASRRVEVRFENIDKHSAGRYSPYAYDTFFVQVFQGCPASCYRPSQKKQPVLT
ncbi:MAG: hypothetical protein CMI16_12985 [Opitutaceae bacterium]|nr:hypothetical protein [Opitutaceae bacterium]